jgi:hypothetical protein
MLITTFIRFRRKVSFSSLDVWVPEMLVVIDIGLSRKSTFKVRPMLLFVKWFSYIILILCVEQYHCSSSSHVETAVFGNASGRGTIAIGYLMDQLSAPYRIGAIQLAIEDGQAN